MRWLTFAWKRYAMIADITLIVISDLLLKDVITAHNSVPVRVILLTAKEFNEIWNTNYSY